MLKDDRILLVKEEKPPRLSLDSMRTEYFQHMISYVDYVKKTYFVHANKSEDEQYKQMNYPHVPPCFLFFFYSCFVEAEGC